VTEAAERRLPGDNRALASVATQFFINGAVVSSYVPRLPGLRDRLDIDLRTIGTLIALATLGGLLGSAMVSSLLARFGTKWTMTGGSLLLVLVLPIVGVVNATWQLMVVLGLIGAADVVTDVAMNVQGSAISERRRAPVMNRLHGMWSLGTVVGGGVASLMAALDISLQTHLAAAGAVLLITLGFVVPGLRTDHDVPVAPSTKDTSSGGRLVVLFAILGAAAIIPEMVNSDWAAFRLTDDLAMSSGVAALAYVAFTTGMVVGRFSGDQAVVRLGSYRLLQAATIVAAVGVATAMLLPNAVFAFVGLFIAGLGVSVMFPQLYDNAARSPRPGPALAGLTAGSRLALVVAPALVGVLADLNSMTVGSAIAIVTIPAAVALLGLTPRPAPAP